MLTLTDQCSTVFTVQQGSVFCRVNYGLVSVNGVFVDCCGHWLPLTGYDDLLDLLIAVSGYLHEDFGFVTYYEKRDVGCEIGHDHHDVDW